MVGAGTWSVEEWILWISNLEGLLYWVLTLGRWGATGGGGSLGMCSCGTRFVTGSWLILSASWLPWAEWLPWLWPSAVMSCLISGPEPLSCPTMDWICKLWAKMNLCSPLYCLCYRDKKMTNTLELRDSKAVRVLGTGQRRGLCRGKAPNTCMGVPLSLWLNTTFMWRESPKDQRITTGGHWGKWGVGGHAVLWDIRIQSGQREEPHWTSQTFVWDSQRSA